MKILASHTAHRAGIRRVGYINDTDEYCTFCSHRRVVTDRGYIQPACIRDWPLQVQLLPHSSHVCDRFQRADEPHWHTPVRL